ncbi:MAG: PHP domain-containing protein [Bacilli bacterium]|nr:PHP domain-containing protein [Bacilli bacterium]
MPEDKIIDLHVHSNNSDGTFSPKQLINFASDNNVGIFAITDHDSISGLNEFKNNISENMLGINGIEFSSYIYDANQIIKIHILGYCFDEKNLLFQSLVNEMKYKRINAHLKLLKELKSKIRMLPEDEIRKLDITRYCWFDREVIKCLETAGFKTELLDEIRNYYKINRFSYGIDYELDVRRVIDAIHLAGGYVVFAHPMAYKFSTDRDIVKRIIDKLSVMGIDGIEIYQSDCTQKDTLWLKDITDSNNLLYSVGSDFHRNVNSDGRKIGLGIENNLCISETTLTNEIIKSKKYFKKVN